MPVVPTIRRQVDIAPLAVVRQSPDAPAAAFSGALPSTPDLTGVTREAIRIHQESSDKADQVAVLDADNKLSELGTQLQTQALQLKGRDAMGAKQQTVEAWQRSASEIEGTLEGDRQKLAFRNRAAMRWASLNETIERHTAAESARYDDETTQGALANRANDALTNYSDPAKVGHAIAEQRAILTDAAKRRGLPPELLQAQIADTVSRTHTSVVERMLANGQDQAASEYFAANKASFAGDDATKVERALEVGSSIGESQRQADAITAKGGTLQEQVAAARQITDPKVRDLTEDRIRRSDAENRAAAREASEQRTLAATNIIERTHDFSAIPPATIAQLTLGERSQLRAYARSFEPGADKQVTDMKTWLSLRSLASNPDTREKFARMDPLSYINELSPSDFKSMVELRDSIRSKDQHVEETLDNTNYRHGIITNTLRSIGFLVDPKTGKVEKPEAAVMYRSVDDAVVEFQEKAGRKATSKEVQQIADELATSHVVATPGRFFGTNEERRPLFTLPENGSLVVTAKDIPAADRSAIAQELVRRGQRATDANIVAAYRQHLTSLVHRGPR